MTYVTCYFFFKYGASNRNDYYPEIIAKFGIEIDYLKRIEKYLKIELLFL